MWKINQWEGNGKGSRFKKKKGNCCKMTTFGLKIRVMKTRPFEGRILMNNASIKCVTERGACAVMCWGSVGAAAPRSARGPSHGENKNLQRCLRPFLAFSRLAFYPLRTRGVKTHPRSSQRAVPVLQVALSVRKY